MFPNASRLLLVTGWVMHIGTSKQALDSKDGVHKEFWDALAEVAEVEYLEAKHTEEADRARMRGEPEPEHRGEVGLHAAVDNDIQMLLAGAQTATVSLGGYLGRQSVRACVVCGTRHH